MQKMIIFEEWKDLNILDIKKDLYSISNCGNIMNKITGKLLSKIYSNGYLTCQLQTINNDRKSYYIHILVALSFIPNDNPDANQVNHKDLHRDHNLETNLEWTTQLENLAHEFLNKGNSPTYENIGDNNWGNGEITCGENNGMSKWTDNQVHLICKALEMGYSYAESLIYAGIENNENNRMNVSHIAQKKRWKHISKLYNIPQPKQYMNFSQYVKDTCILLSKDTDISDIINILNLPGNYKQNSNFINGIKRRENYTNISKDYNW